MIENNAPGSSNSFIHSMWIITALLLFFLSFAGGFTVGMKLEQGQLKNPQPGVIYKLSVVATPKDERSGKYYTFGKYFKEIKVIEKDLSEKLAIFENGKFKLVETK